MPLGPSSPSEDSGRNRERTVRENDVRQSGISNTGSQNTDGRASGYSPEPVDDTPPEVPDTSVLSVSARPYQKNKTAKYRLRVQDPNNDLVAAEYAVRRPQTAVVQFARSPDIEWENQYDSNVHAYARLSDDFFRNEITGLLDSSLGRTEFRSIRFARSAERPGVSSKSYNPDTNNTTWSRTPPSGSDPLWVIHGVINTSTTTLVENWSDPLRRVPYSWTEISPKEEERGSSEYIISEPFKENGSDSFEIFWRVRHRPSQEKRGGNEFDRDPDAEFTANLRLLGQDARLELEGDEDTASYKIATSRGTVGFPDPSGGDYVEGRTFTGQNQINLGYLEPGQQINVSVRAYSDLSENGNVQDGGQTRRLTLTTTQERPVPQVRFGLSKTGKFYSEYDGSYSYMQVSFNRGLTWEKAVDIEQESAATGKITSAYYFARGFGAPEINPFGDNPGPAWSDTPPAGESTLWVTSGPVDDTGTLAGGRWETPYPVVAEVPPKTLPPTEAAAQYSATNADPENAAAWDKNYDPDLNHEYIRLSWDQGNSWQSVHMETPTSNPKDSDGKTVTRNPVNRFTRSSTAPTVTDRTTYNGPDFTKWTDLPPTGSEDIWMISALADLDNEILVAGDWSEPIRLRNLSDPGNLIEFGESAEGPWTPFYENDTTHFHLSLDNTLSWTGADQVSDAYFQKSGSQPNAPTDPSTNNSWAETPEFSNAGSNQGEGTSGTPTWITRPDGVGGWMDPMKVRRDSGKRGPESDEVTIQYSADKLSWHDEFREGDVWMRQRVGEGVWQGPTRIVGEGGQNGVYLAYYFQANNSPDTAPKINANDDPTEDRGSGWVDGPGQALDNGGRFVWGITAQFLVDQSQTEDIRQTDWDGPYRVNGEDATQRFIRPTNGTAIKNSNPDKTLGLETVQITGSQESLISSGDPKLYVEDGGGYTTVSNYFSGISDDHEPSFGVTEIQGNLTVYLRDTDGNNLDTITLADLTDGVSAGYVLSPDGLAVTHYSGRDTDAVKPGSLPLIATFVDSEGTEHQQQINVNPTENASKNLEVSWSAATSSDSDPQSDQIGFTVKSNGSEVTSPVTSPRELVFTFTGTDPNTGEETVFSEQVQFTEDDGIYKIKSLDGATLREGGDNLRFEVTRTDGEGTSTVGLTSGGFKLVLRPTGSATEFTGSPATIADSDLNTGPQTLQLQDGSGNVLDSITVIKASLGVSSLQANQEQITQDGSEVGKLTFEVVDRYKDSVDTITTRKASGRNFKSTDSFGSDITESETPPYTETVNLEQKRASYIEVKVTYTDSQPTTRQTFSFDHDLRPEAKYIVPKGKAEPYLAVANDELEYEPYPAIQYYVSAQGDEDVASFRTVFIHAEGDTSNEEKFVYERKGNVLDNVPLHPTKDLLDPNGFILGGATIREDLEPGESRNDYTARVKVEAYSDWDPDANGGNGGVAGKKDQNAFDQQVGIEGGAFPEFTPEITRFNANPVHRGGGSALLSVGVNKDAEGFQINWKTFDKDGNLLQTYSDVNGDPSAIVDPGTAQFSAPTPPGPDATDDNGNNIGPGYGWIEVTPIGSPAYTTENIKGASERISIGPSKAYNTLFSVTGGSSSTTAVATDTSKPGQLDVEATTDDGGQKYNVNAPQDIGTNATPTFSGLDFGGSNSVNEISDDTSLSNGSATSLPTENAVKTYVDSNRYTNSEAISAVTSEDPITFDGTVSAPTVNATSTFLLPSSTGDGSGGGGGGSVADFDAGRSLFTENVDASTVLNVELVSGSGINLTEVSGTNTNAYEISTSVDVGVNTFAGRSGDVNPSTGDYSASQISGFGSAAISAINNDSDHGSTASHNYFSGNYSDLSGTPSIAYNSTIAADAFTSTEVSNLRSGQLDDGTTPWTANNYFDGSDARDAVDGSDITPNNVTVSGNLTVNGTKFITNTETVKIQDNLAVINNGETGSGVTEGFAGWEVDRGDLTNYFFGFDESRYRFVVGQGTSGRQVVATREDSPDGSAIAYWDDTTNKYVTSTDVVVGSNGSSLKAKTVNATGTLLLPSSTGSGSGGGGGSVADFDAGRSLFTESVNGATALNVELVSGSGINLTEVSGANTNAYKISASVDAGVNTFAGRSGDVSPSPGDYSASQISGFDSAAASAVSASDVGLGNVPNTNIAYSSTIPADNFTSTEVSNLRSGQLEDGTTPWTSNNYYDDSDAVSAVESEGTLSLNEVYFSIGEGLRITDIGDVGGVSGNDTRAIRIEDSNSPNNPDGALVVTTGDDDKLLQEWYSDGVDFHVEPTVNNNTVWHDGNKNIAYSSTIPADDFTSTEVSNLRSGKLDDGTTPWTSNNYYDDNDARSAVSANDVGLGNVPNTNIAYSSTIPADNFTSTEVSNLRSGQLEDGTTPWTSNNYYDDNDARSAVSKSDVGLGNVPNQDPRSEMRNLGLKNAEMDGSWVGGQSGGQVGYDASVGLFLDYGSSGNGITKDVYPVLDAGNTKTGGNVNVTYGGIDTRPKISLSQGSGSGLDADKLDGVHLSNIGFGDISASPYTDSDARNAVTDTDLPGNLRLTNGGIIGISGGPEIEFEGNGIEVQGVERLSFGDQSGNVNGLDMSNKTIGNAGSIDASGTVDFSSANSVILPTV